MCRKSRFRRLTIKTFCVMKANISKIRNGLADVYPKQEIDAMVRIIFEQLMGYSTVDMVLRADSGLACVWYRSHPLLRS